MCVVDDKLGVSVYAVDDGVVSVYVMNDGLVCVVVDDGLVSVYVVDDGLLVAVQVVLLLVAVSVPALMHRISPTWRSSARKYGVKMRRKHGRETYLCSH